MKRFLVSFLGAVTAIWVSVILFIIGLLAMVGVLVASGSSAPQQISKHSVLYLNLDMTVVEYAQKTKLMERLYSRDFTLTTPLQDIVNAIDRASKDDHIDGMFIDCNGLSAGLAQIDAIAAAIERFRKSGRWVYAYGDVIAQADYLTVCGADSIFLNPVGSVDIHGLQSTTMYYKGLLDKLGIEMQVVKVGTYKSAVEPYSMTGPSEASVEQQKLFLNNIWDVLKKRIADSRHVTTADVDRWADSLSTFRDDQWYLKDKLVDRIVYRHEMMDILKAITTTDDVNMVTPSDYLASNRNMPGKGKAKIAVYYAEGDIVDEGDSGIVGARVAEDLIDIADDDDIDALVIRVNSPGGSAFASEQIWEAVEQFKTLSGKPCYVSMSDYAASGGYYMSCGADRIYAEPTTLTGSIGIFGLIPNFEGLTKGKLGLNVSSVSTNPEGRLPDVFNALTPAQRATMQSTVDRGYELFVKRVAEGRGLTVDSVKTIAEGRVWDGAEALRIGLVDSLGGLDKALADLAAELNVEKYEIINFPDNGQDLWRLILADVNNIKAGIVDSELGGDAELWRALKSMHTITPLQARMPCLIVK